MHIKIRFYLKKINLRRFTQLIWNGELFTKASVNKAQQPMKLQFPDKICIFHAIQTSEIICIYYEHHNGISLQTSDVCFITFYRNWHHSMNKVYKILKNHFQICIHFI